MWEWLFPRTPDLMLAPQIEAWTDNSHLYDVVLSDLGLDAGNLPLSRAGAMRVPAMARARNLTCRHDRRPPRPGDARRHARSARNRTGRTAQTGSWATCPRNDSGSGGIAPQAPLHRMLWTVDDLLFWGSSLWLVTRRLAGTTTGYPSRMVRVPWDQWTVDDGVIVRYRHRPVPRRRPGLDTRPQ